MGPPMENAMVCHITEGELRVEQDGKTFTAKKDFVWTCNKDTKEQSFNDERFSLRRIFPCVAFWVSRGGLLISLSRAAAEIKQLCIPFARN